MGNVTRLPEINISLNMSGVRINTCGVLNKLRTAEPLLKFLLTDKPGVAPFSAAKMKV